MITAPKTRILLADDHPALLAETAHLLDREHEVVGTVTNGLELLAAAGRLDPDLIVLDISMPGLDGLEAARRLKQAGCRSKLVFLTVWDDADYAREAMALGAAAYVVKSRLASDLPTAIADALADHPFVSPSISLCDLFPQVILKCDTVPLNGNEVTEPKINHQLKH